MTTENNTSKDKLFKAVEALEPDMVSMLSDLVALPAINPSDGGEGEGRKVRKIADKIRSLELGKIDVYKCNDNAGIERPNAVITIPGRTKKRLWIISHVDVVPAGELAQWESDPFKAEVRDGKIYGRGTVDNGLALVSSVYAAAALKKLAIAPEFETKLCFVANEETGSDYGIKFLLKQGLFSSEDLVLVPDINTPDGDFIEIAEKSIFWIEFEVKGKITHGSLPQLGVNACRAANEFSASLDESLHKAFPESDAMFGAPQTSTFEPTRRFANVRNVNTVPGREVFCFDCRVLPSVPFSEIDKVIDYEIRKIKKKYKVEVSYRLLQNQPAPAPTPEDAPIVTLVKEAAETVLPVKVRCGGIGGGTCAAHFREAGIPAAVWGQGSDVEHMPNEYAEIEHIVNSAKVFALVMTANKYN
jgi:succinyl-diaminopimelate desuccinylase